VVVLFLFFTFSMPPALKIDEFSRTSFSDAADSFDWIQAAPHLHLIEIAPAGPGDEVAAIGFALAWMRATIKGGLMLWTAPERIFAEHGAPYAEGLAQFGVDLKRLLIAKTRTQIDALWAAEQGLAVPHAHVLCTIAPSSKPLDLLATRRLFLAAKNNKSRCNLIRFDAARGGAAQLRFEVSPVRGENSVYGLGPPAFDVRLIRNRAGPAGGNWRLEWCAHESVFRTIPRLLDGAVLPVPADRPVETPWLRAG
jgi:protein ImuA